MLVRGFNFKLYMELYKRCPSGQLRHLRKVESKHRSYIEKLNTLPAELPKIDWEYYKSHVRPDYVEMVDDFEIKYKEFEVPMPTETASDEIENEREEVVKMVEEYIAETNERICELEEKIVNVEQQLPFEDMTMEEYIDAFPDTAPNFISRPTFWPHLPDEQEIGPPTRTDL